jgi:hypothetical protein
MPFNDQHPDVTPLPKAAASRETIRTFAAAVRTLAERWTAEGSKAFDEGNTPVEIAEAAGKLRGALELSQLLDAFGDDRHERAAQFNSDDLVVSERRTGLRERRRKPRSDRRSSA